MQIVGVISDTHGLLRPEAVALLSGVDHIIHAGDIGPQQILLELRRIAPLTVVRGNNDRETWARSINPSEELEIGGRRLYVVHDIADMDIDPAAAGVSMVITGHSHKPAIAERDNVVYLNPGSAGPRRFNLPIALATVRISTRAIRPEIHEITPVQAKPMRRERSA